jgi:hypothetical protein
MLEGGPVTAAAVEAACAQEVRERFAEVFGAAAPGRTSVEWQRANLAWAAQAQAAGHRPQELRARLLEGLARWQGRGKDAVAPGTRLVRTWGDETHEVTVLAHGYRWRGRRYRSLSAIAGEITGTRWSGPRFFGLRTTE